MPIARRLPRWVFTLLLPAVLLAMPGRGHAQCGSGDFTYQFVNWCTQPVWIGERSTGDPNPYPPQSGNWAMGGICTDNAACPSGVCDRNGGRCTCTTSADCPGGAVCEADGKCGNTATICLPQGWSSGTFWPRTGCTVDDSTTPVQLACDTGACFNTSGDPLLDCSVKNGGGSPTNPVTQFEVTSSTAAVNYDVSIAAGFNVELKAIPQGGGQPVPATTDTAACPDAGCTGDLNATCPTPLQMTKDGDVIGCLDPCTRCKRSSPPMALSCSSTLGDDWTDCSGGTGPTTYEDLYCAKNPSDGYAQASANQGTPTAFSEADCPQFTTFLVPTFSGSYTLPAGQGVCVYTHSPQSTSGLNDYSWADAGTSTTRSCSVAGDGTACGGYRTNQGSGSYYADALGYTCQTATFPASGGGGTLTGNLCVPPTTGGLGTCTKTTASTLPLYSSTAGLTNADWITASTAAGGGTTPYYETFKTACPGAYTWQYDDAASGYACQVASTTSTGGAFTGFDVTLCASNVEPLTEGTPDRYAGMQTKGRVGGLGRPGRGKLRIRGTTTLPVEIALPDVSVALTDLLDEVGATGELVDTGAAPIPLELAPKKVKAKKAIFETEAGVEPRVKVVLRRKKATAEAVKVIVVARGASIARPAGCDAADEVSLETGLNLGAGGEVTRVGTVGRWRCGKKALRGG